MIIKYEIDIRISHIPMRPQQSKFGLIEKINRLRIIIFLFLQIFDTSFHIFNLQSQWRIFYINIFPSLKTNYYLFVLIRINKCFKHILCFPLIPNHMLWIALSLFIPLFLLMVLHIISNQRDCIQYLLGKEIHYGFQVLLQANLAFLTFDNSIRDNRQTTFILYFKFTNPATLVKVVQGYQFFDSST